MGAVRSAWLSCSSAVVLQLGVLAALAACSSDDPSVLRGRSSAQPVGAAPAQDPGAGSGTPSSSGSGPTMAAPDDGGPGPPPAGCGEVQTDGSGFFQRSSARGPYVGFVPKSYTGKPMRLIVGLHGCGDDAYNFATWGVAPESTRETQDWIAISVGGETGGGSCWKQSDAPIVLAAIDDVSTCFYVHKHQVVLAGFSSGGELAYGMGLQNASRFAGILGECTGLSAAGDPATLLAGASWKLPIAHLAHTGDPVFPIAGVRADWAKIEAAGFPLQKRETGGVHDGVGEDWSDWLLPIGRTWTSP